MGAILKVPSFQVMAISMLMGWVLLSAFIIFGSPQLADNMTSLIQLMLYALSLFIMRKVYLKCNTITRQVLSPFLFAICIALLTDFINYLDIFVFKDFNFLIHDYSQVTLSGLNRFLSTADYIEIFFWYILILVFLLNLFRVFFIRQSRYQIQFITFAAYLVSVLIALLYLSQPEKLQHSNFATLMAFSSSIIEIATFIVAIYGLIHSKSWSLAFLLSSVIIMVTAQISALFNYSYHMQEFL